MTTLSSRAAKLGSSGFYCPIVNLSGASELTSSFDSLHEALFLHR
jgi:hypothetical protein